MKKVLRIIFLMTGLAIAALSQPAVADEPASAPTADAVLQRLMEGNHRFVDGHPAHPDGTVVRRLALRGGQTPVAVIVCCSDSRVPPELVFDQGLGNLFVVRDAGNVTDDVAIASIEYAVEHLHIPLVVVLGHQRCGAVIAAVSGQKLNGHLNKLMAEIQPAVEACRATPGDLVENTVRENVQRTVLELCSCELLAERLKHGQLRIVGAHYSLETGTVELIPEPIAGSGEPSQLRH